MAVRILTFVLWVAAAALAGGPERIISTSPSITEMLYALGLGDKVVGVTSYCHFPPEVRDKAKIGNYLRPDLETIVSLQPDLVVALAEHGELRPRLERLGLKVLDLQHNDLTGIYRSINKLSQQTGVPERGAALVQRIQNDLEAVRRRAEDLPRRSTLFIVGRTPGAIQGVVVVGAGPFLNELIEIAGGDNLLREAGQHYPQISRETILVRRPEVILDMGDMAATDGVTAEHKRSIEALWRREFPQIPAVTAGRVYAVADDRYVVPGPRVAEAAKMLFELIHPEAVR